MTILDNLLDFLRSSPDPAAKALLEKTELRTFKRGTLLFQEGKVPPFVAFLKEGVVRAFLTDKEGKDHTDFFCYRPGEPVVPSLPLNAPASMDAEVVRDTTLLCFPTQEVTVLLERDANAVRIYNHFLIYSLGRHMEIKKVLYLYTAMERYRWFLENYPDLSGKVSGKHIASFLGITPVTLSRLRKSMRLRTEEETEEDTPALP